MTVLSVLSARGGSGASIVATNLGILLADQGEALLVDLHPGLGYDDLLLDLRPQKTWEELLPVAPEITPHHLTLASSVHSSGLRLLGAPHRWLDEGEGDQMVKMLMSLSDHVGWLILDVPAGLGPYTTHALQITDVIILVATPDPPALRSASRMIDTLPTNFREKIGLVINQITRRHPAKPREVADSLGLPLLAALPPDPRGVGYQVNFGQPCVQDPRSRLGQAIRLLARRIRVAVEAQESRASVGGES